MMAHFAQIDSNNIVTQVIVVADADTADAQGNHMESIGIAFCQRLIGGNWKQTSYNTLGGVHSNGGTPLRGNYAGIGYTYDPTNDVFYAPQPYPSWTISAPNWTWTPPVPYPTDVGTPEAPKRYTWNESTKTWDLVN
jgi:hypothetical protein